MLSQLVGSVAKKTRSPGSIASRGTVADRVARYCGRAVRGSRTPTERYASWTRLEQSKDSVPLAPKT